MRSIVLGVLTPAFILTGCGQHGETQALAERDRTITAQALQIAELKAEVETQRLESMQRALSDNSARMGALNERRRAEIAESQTARLAGDMAAQRRQESSDAIVRAAGGKPLADF